VTRKRFVGVNVFRAPLPPAELGVQLRVHLELVGRRGLGDELEPELATTLMRRHVPPSLSGTASSVLHVITMLNYGRARELAVERAALDAVTARRS
jgi:hypothetical protein